jgi:hypothetical protein
MNRIIFLTFLIFQKNSFSSNFKEMEQALLDKTLRPIRRTINNKDYARAKELLLESRDLILGLMKVLRYDRIGVLDPSLTSLVAEVFNSQVITICTCQVVERDHRIRICCAVTNGLMEDLRQHKLLLEDDIGLLEPHEIQELEQRERPLPPKMDTPAILRMLPKEFVYPVKKSTYSTIADLQRFDETQDCWPFAGVVLLHDYHWFSDHTQVEAKLLKVHHLDRLSWTPDIE